MLLLNYIDDEDELLQVESAVVCTKSTAQHSLILSVDMKFL